MREKSLPTSEIKPVIHPHILIPLLTSAWVTGDSEVAAVDRDGLGNANTE
jgi:hypothetical protein